MGVVVARVARWQNLRVDWSLTLIDALFVCKKDDKTFHNKLTRHSAVVGGGDMKRECYE